MKEARSKQLLAKSRRYIPGGVNSPVRACGNVGCDPVFYESATGSHVWDVDGNEYLDFIGSWGPMILGHRPSCVLSAVIDQLERGTSFGAPCAAEAALAQMICEVVPAVEQVRMVSSGTEATMSALRLARGFTNRPKIIKCEGNYHGHSDALLVGAGSGVATFGIPGTRGVTKNAVADTLMIPYNNLEALRRVFEANRDEVAAVIIEPVAGNMGVVSPCEGYLSGVQELCHQFGALLIFDEVITGFRLALGGAQEYFNVKPDLCCFGKIIGGGFPVGAFGGPEEIMSLLAPQGPVYQAGTLSGNPVAMEAGLATLQELKHNPPYAYLENLGAQLQEGLETIIADTGIAATVNRVGSVATLFFTNRTVTCWDDARTCDEKMFSTYYRAMRDQGFLIAPSQYEALFLSAAHSVDEIDAFIVAARHALEEMA